MSRRIVLGAGWLLAALGSGLACGCVERTYTILTLPPGAMVLGCLGRGQAALPNRRASRLPRLIHPVLPALWDDAGLAAVPHLGWRREDVAALPRLLFRPANPLSRASFTVV